MHVEDGARRSCAARTRKPLQEVKMSYFLDYLQNVRT